jgi:hypothetical protein
MAALRAATGGRSVLALAVAAATSVMFQSVTMSARTVEHMMSPAIARLLITAVELFIWFVSFL